MMKILPIITMLLTSWSSLSAQSRMDIEAAMAYAVENNLDVESQRVSNENDKVEQKVAVASLFPSLSANSSISNSYGRSIDPETNAYGSNSYINNSYGVSGSVTLFGGLAKINALKASRLRVEMGGEELQQIKDERALQVMRLYYDAIYYLTSVELMKDQLEASRQVLQYTQKLSELGLKSEVDVALATAEVAKYELQHTQQEGQYSETILDLKEAMNYPLQDDFEVIDNTANGVARCGNGFDIESDPDIRVAKMELLESELNLRQIRGGYLPTVSLYGGFNTNYFRQLDAESAQRIFSDQLRDNQGYYVGLNLSVPIFNGLSRRGSVAQSRNSLRIAQIDLSKKRIYITKYIEQVEMWSTTSYKEYTSAERKIEAYDLANRAMMQRYREGLVDIIDLQESANDLLLSKVERLRAWLNYQIYITSLNFYSSI
ncbi:MAG: TolC family protein [Rikenellaceae bacterium]